MHNIKLLGLTQFIFFVLFAFNVLCLQLSGQNFGTKQKDINTAVPVSALRLVKRAVELADQGKALNSVALLKKAMSIAPDYLEAHTNYIRIKTLYLDEYDEMRREYEALLRKELDNPVYLMALALEEPIAPQKINLARFQKVSERAPDWIWSSFARAEMLKEKEPQKAVAELLKIIGQNVNSEKVYESLLELQEKKLNDVDGAISTAEKMAVVPELKANGLSHLWRLKLSKSKNSDQAKTELRNGLQKLAAETRDVNVLNSIRLAYLNLLKDKESSDKTRKLILQLSPKWNSYKGVTTSKFAPTSLGLPRHIITINHQSSFIYKIIEIANNAEPTERIAELEKLLESNPSENVRYYIYTDLLSSAEAANNQAAIARYGEILLKKDSAGSIWYSKIALALAEQNKNLPAALNYANMAVKKSSELNLSLKTLNTNPDFLKDSFNEEWLRSNHKWMSALALDALGRVQFRMGNYKESEVLLRQAVANWRTEKNLSHLSETLSKLGRTEEANDFAEQAKTEYVTALKRRFTNYSAKEFKIKTIDGREVKLSDLKGKVVVLNFWAAWCAACYKEAPHLVDLYKKYRDQGLEILAVSADSQVDEYKIAPFAKQFDYKFPIFFDKEKELQEIFNVKSFPTNIFIDKEGKVRFRQIGFNAEIPRRTETIVNELLK